MGHKFYLKRDEKNGVERWTLYETQRRGRSKLGSLRGWRLSVALPYIRKLSHQLRSGNPDNSNHRLAEEDGVRLALTFLGIGNLRRLEKAETLCREISAISQEEAYYWYAKALGYRPEATGIRALRVLFGHG